MEESGHYYTVYFVSLAVGFDQRTAKEAALYTQMADEIEELDAVDREIAQYGLLTPSAAGGVIGQIIGALVASAIINSVSLAAARVPFLAALGVGIVGMTVGALGGTATGIKIQEMLDSTTMRENEWRLCVEYGLHALTGRDAEQERKKTTEMLRSTLPTDNVRFGLLLHRLGDTYAHTDPDGRILHKSSKSMASFIRGHLFEGTHADHPWERQELFFKYLENLYVVLDERVKKIRIQKNKILKFDDIKNIFRDILYLAKERSQSVIDQMGFISRHVYESVKPATGLFESQKEPEKEAQKTFAKLIKIKAKTHLKINMDVYSPENEDLISLEEFLRRHKIRDKGGKIITSQDIKNSVTQIANEIANQ